MKSQDIGLLQTVVDAITGLADAGTTVGVSVVSVAVRFPDNSVVLFNQDTETPETDWYITAGGPGVV